MFSKILSMVLLASCAVSSLATVPSCPSGYKHMTSVYCGKNPGVKLLTCSNFDSTSLCQKPSKNWMLSVCKSLFGTQRSYSPKWEETESGCYPDESNPSYWQTYNGYTLSGDFCTNFPKVKKTNNLQFERGDLTFWSSSGQVSVVKTEDGIKSKIGKFMGKLQSNGETPATIYRDDFFVPTCAKSIQFYYNLLTNEAPDGVTKYPDPFIASIEDLDGNTLLSIKYNALDIQSYPPTATGVWLHASGWRKAVLPLKNIPKDQILRLKFSAFVANELDTSFDSAILLDSIKYNL
jgi:hypothetical protein